LSQTGTLLFIGLNPPLTSGTRTRGRVELARSLLGFDSIIHSNLFALPTHDLAGVAAVGATEEGWLEARHQLVEQVARADAALLGFGVQSPSGDARRWFRAQVSWLEAELAQADTPVWEVGGAPRHPSRWQRYTHRTFSDRPFATALEEALRQRELQSAAGSVG
jgi:hypothetical protein